jgi:hypothetical protein
MKRVLFIALLIAIIIRIVIVQTGIAATIPPVTDTTVQEEIAEEYQEPEEPEKEVEEEQEIKEPEEVINYTTYDIPENRGFKSYMDYRTITSTGSKQFQLQNLYANTGDYGIRMVNDRFCIAVGTHFDAQIGQYLDLILENGSVIPCVLADVKADIHTESNNIVTLHNGCVSEFVVYTPSLHNMAKRMGDVSYCCEEWKSPVVEIIVYEQNAFDSEGGKEHE